MNWGSEGTARFCRQAYRQAKNIYDCLRARPKVFSFTSKKSARGCGAARPLWGTDSVSLQRDGTRQHGTRESRKERGPAPLRRTAWFSSRERLRTCTHAAGTRCGYISPQLVKQ